MLKWHTCAILTIYVSFTSCLSHLGSWDSCTPWNASCILVYLHAYVHDLQLRLNSRTTGATRVCHKDYRERQVGECADTWYKRIQPTADSGAVAAWQLPNAPVWIKMMTNELTVLLFCDVHTNKGVTLDLLQCLCVICGCRSRAVQTNKLTN